MPKEVLSGHPGATVMWLSGAGEWIYKKIAGFPKDVVPWGKDLPKINIPQGSVLSGILPLVLVISLGNCLAFFLLSKIFKRKTAFLGAIFIAVEPFYLAQSKVLHIDATLTNFMLLSTLSLFVYLKDKNPKYIALSGFFGGLALLTKTPALFLLPFLVLSLVIFAARKKPAFKMLFSEVAKPAAVWILTAVITFAILFPPIWQKPAETLKEIFLSGIKAPISTPHPYQNYFFGEITNKPLGFKFYLFTLLLLTTPLTLIGAVSLAVALVAKKLDQITKKLYFLILAYCFFFLFAVSLVAKSGSRYLTPLFPMLALASAVGCSYLAREVIAKIANGGKQIASALFLVVFLLNAALILKKHPYYGTYFNPLLGGANAASFVFPLGEQGEGIKEALDFIHQKEGNQESLTIGCDTESVCLQHTKAKIVKINDASADYIIFSRNKIVRGHENETWRMFKNVNPEKVISFDGLPYAWVYKTKKD